MIPNPDIFKTSGLNLYACTSMSVLIIPIDLNKISHHVTESIVQTLVWAVSHLGPMKQDMF